MTTHVQLISFPRIWSWSMEHMLWIMIIKSGRDGTVCCSEELCHSCWRWASQSFKRLTQLPVCSSHYPHAYGLFYRFCRSSNRRGARRIISVKFQLFAHAYKHSTLQVVDVCLSSMSSSDPDPRDSCIHSSFGTQLSTRRYVYISD
jgi:hypothetical protein